MRLDAIPSGATAGSDGSSPQARARRSASCSTVIVSARRSTGTRKPRGVVTISPLAFAEAIRSAQAVLPPLSSKITRIRSRADFRISPTTGSDMALLRLIDSGEIPDGCSCQHTTCGWIRKRGDQRVSLRLGEEVLRDLGSRPIKLHTIPGCERPDLCERSRISGQGCLNSTIGDRPFGEELVSRCRIPSIERSQHGNFVA